MEYSKNNFSYAKQIDPNYCGPASVEMLLRYYGLKADLKKNDPLQKHIAALEKAYLSQTQVQTNANSETDPWGKWVTRPVEIVNMLHGFVAKDPPLSKLWYNHFRREQDHSQNVSNFLTALESKIKDPDQPPLIVPIHDNSHWVVIYKLNDDEQTKTFIGKDPLYFKQTEEVSSYGITSLKGTISISSNPLNFSSPLNLLMIEKNEANDDINSRHGWQSIDIPISPIRLPGTLMTPAAILEIVRAWLSKSGSLELSSIGRRSSPFNLSPPLLVRRADRDNYDYYLVAVKNNNDKVTQLIRLDAITGEYLDSMQLDPTVLHLELSPNNLVTQGVLGKINARQSASATLASNAQNLMWQPTVESQSAFYPFHEVIIGGQPSYLRIDGTPFARITPTSTPVIAPPESSHM